jgi:uncharacterized RDD family membrane protein YckC
MGSRCPACGALPPPPTEGALAPDPARAEPLREIPGLRKRERTWKDEVRERVRDRRRFRGGPGELPLFKGLDDADDADPAGDLAAAPEHEGPIETGLGTHGDAGADDDLPLRPRDEVRPAIAFEPPRPAPIVRDVVLPPAAEPDHDAWDLGPPARVEAPRPVERPAIGLERLYAAAVDLAVLATVWAAVVYFASRTARVAIPALQPTWPWLAGYLAFLGLVYAGYFTGTTGQTLGKMAAGLRVVDAGGQPPGYIRAASRALIGSCGVLVAGGGLVPMLFDPARRALHDRVFRTRVIKG